MGLDMYLNKRRDVENWNKESKWKITVTNNGKEVKDNLPVKYVEYDVGYWRKANAVHKWFVDHCAGGDPNETEMYVSSEQLKQLQELCRKAVDTAKVRKGKVVNGYSIKEVNGKLKKIPIYEKGFVITNPEDVAELLPTQSGFFFGSTDYDQYYLDDVIDTIEICDKALANADGCEFIYRASW